MVCIASMGNTKAVPQKINIGLPCHPGISCPGIEPKEQKTSCMLMFTILLFTIAK